MIKHPGNLCIVEYGVLHRGENLAGGGLPVADFDWLTRTSIVADRLFTLVTPDQIKATNYVGVVRCPSGLQIEILPKIADIADAGASRRLVMRMLQSGLGLEKESLHEADLIRAERQLFDWILEGFLSELGHLLVRGLRAGYVDVEERSSWLRGRLMMNEWSRQLPSQSHLFPQRRSEFSLNRPENRLIKLALSIVRRLVSSSDLWAKAREYELWMDGIDVSKDWRRDWAVWDSGHLMQDYRGILPWTHFILSGQLPFTQSGESNGYSWLLPMETLFERHVAGVLRKSCPANWKLRYQAGGYHLLSEAGVPRVGMKPDFVASNGMDTWVLDAKWKLIGKGHDILGDVTEADLYQMNAYSLQVTSGNGHTVLIYPAFGNFTNSVGPLKFMGSERGLKIVAFDLATDQLRAPFPFVQARKL